MANFNFTFPIPTQEYKIEFDKSILFLGSCFSDEIGKQAKLCGLKSIANPFGTLFHPIAIGQSILDSLNETKSCKWVQKDDVFFHWGSSGKIHAYSQLELENKLIIEQELQKTELKLASHLFLTFGTAKGYRLKENKELVANCHKQHPSLFEIKVSKAHEIVDFWQPLIQQLKRLNPNLQLIFTVSPVRHLKDGIVENNRSKAELLLAVEILSEIENCSYFPSYEIVLDELRDYRFYNSDFSHPNELAISYVWERFSRTFFSEETRINSEKVRAIKIALNHKGLYEKSFKLQEHQLLTLQKKEKLNQEIKGIFW